MVTDYKVPLIEYSKASRRQIHEVFNLYNKQGKHLNAEEIRNALFHDIAFMRALMVASGDIDKVEEVAPFLLPNWTTLEAMSSVLEGFGIGTARYRRTKVLSWLAAMLFVDSIEGGRPRRLSTAKHIDFLLGRIELDGDDPFRNGQTINEALLLIMRGMKAHADVKRAFSPNFRDTKTGTKWQELQLVASLLGICLAAAVLEEKTADRLAFIATELGEKTAAPSWQRPRKTQTGTQWEYIARIALDIVDVMGVNRFEASEALARRFGYSCIPTLELIVAGIKSP